MVYSSYTKQRILHYYSLNYNPSSIQKVLLEEEDIVTTWQGIAGFLKTYRLTGRIDRHPGSSRPTKVTSEVKLIVDEQKRKDDVKSTSPVVTF